MKPRAIYYRKKNKTIVIEGRQGRKSVLIWTLPHPEKLLSEILENPSLFTKEKSAKIIEKVKRLDYKSEKVKNHVPKVRSVNIIRTQKKDGIVEDIAVLPDLSKEERKALWELSK